MMKRASATKLVLDCSIVMAWFFEDEADPYADAIQSELPIREAVVPSIWPMEVANVLIVGERRKRSIEAKSAQFLSLLANLPIAVDHASTSQIWSDVVRLARTHQLSVYDATYLELAFREGLKLATLDDKLKRAARAGGIKVFEP